MHLNALYSPNQKKKTILETVKIATETGDYDSAKKKIPTSTGDFRKDASSNLNWPFCQWRGLIKSPPRRKL